MEGRKISNPTTQFKKGNQAAVGHGRPKREWTWSSLMEEAMEEEDETGEPFKKIIVKKMRALGVKGDMMAIKEIINRMDGMPQQDITSGGEAIKSPTIFIPEEKE